jgi:hypothetical protein
MGAIGDAIGGVVNSVASGIGDFVDTVESTVSDTASSLLQTVSDGFDAVGSVAATIVDPLGILGLNSSGGLPSLGDLAQSVLGAASQTGTNMESYIKDLIAQLDGQASLENGSSIHTGTVPQRDFSAESAALQEVLAHMQASGQLGNIGSSSGAATAANYNASSGNAGDATSIVNDYRAQSQGGTTEGLSSYQEGLLSGIKDTDQKEQMRAQMKMQNLTRDAAFYSEMAKMMHESLQDIIRKMG